MLKKFWAGIFLLMIISAQASAMRLELYPQPIGKITFDGKTFQIDGATKIKGDSSKGRALFGDKFFLQKDFGVPKHSTSEDNEIYGGKFFFHFDAAKKICSFGDSDKKNSVNVDIHGEAEIFFIRNTAGSDLFLIKQASGTGDAIKVLSLRDGKWTVYLDALSLREKYDIGWNFHMSKFFTEDNKIIFRYTLHEHFIDVICRLHMGNQKFYTEVREQ